MLTAPDMQHYELQGDCLSCVDDGVRKAFRHIFDDARAQSGFNTEGEKLFIQLYASRDGGCEIFVTKLGVHISRDMSQALTNASHTETSCSLSPAEEALLNRIMTYDEKEKEPYDSYAKEDEYMDAPISTALSRPTAYRSVILTTIDLPSLLAVCHRLLSVGYSNQSCAYITEVEDHRLYHLSLELPDGGFYLLSDAYAFLREYGDIKEMGETALYLSEHGQQLCSDDAVSILGQL